MITQAALFTSQIAGFLHALGHYKIRMKDARIFNNIIHLLHFYFIYFLSLDIVKRYKKQDGKQKFFHKLFSYVNRKWIAEVVVKQQHINIQKPLSFYQFRYFAQISIYMNEKLMEEQENELHSMMKPRFPQQPVVVRIASKIISYIFHPVFVPLYVVWFMVYLHPYLFTGFSDLQKTRTVMMAIVSFTFFPLVTVLLLKGLKFIETIYLHTQKDRVIPFLACMIWYFWIWYVWNNFGQTRDVVDIPREAVQFALATFISTIIGLMVNIKIKVSLHAISMGIMVAFMLLLAFQQNLNFGVYLSFALFITGLVCTSRFIISDHTPQEVYGGLVVGIISITIAAWVG